MTKPTCETEGCLTLATWRIENTDPEYGKDWLCFRWRCTRHAPPPSKRTRWNSHRIEKVSG